GAVQAVPPLVSELSARSLRLRQAAVLGLAGGSSRPAGIRPLPRTTAEEEMGRLCQGALRRSSTGARLRRSLHSPCGHLQQPLARPGRRSGPLSLEGLPRQPSTKNNDAVG